MDNPFALLELLPVQEAKGKDAKIKTHLVDETPDYKIGKPTRPAYEHDNGHLGKPGEPLKPTRPPTPGDWLAQRSAYAYLNGSELICAEHEIAGIKFSASGAANDCGGNQPDANLAYRHFLEASGTSRTIDYEKYIREEENGPKMAPALAKAFIPHAETIGRNRIKFSVTSKKMYLIGGTSEKRLVAGPQRTNWTRAIGAHVIWVSADVAVTATATQILYEANLTMYVEDRYNFNPGSKDDKSGKADSDNGRLELSGLAKQYMTYATWHRNLKWVEGDGKSVVIMPK